MKITALEAWRVDMPLREPYTIAYETVDKASNVFIRMDTDSGLTGWGCAAPDPEITGEHPEDVLQAIQEKAAPMLRGEDPLRWTYLLERLKSHLPAHASTRAALDMALFDILGKKARVPLWKLLGGHHDGKFLTSITVGILSQEETLARASEYVSRGFKALKIKGGLNVEDDIARVKAVRLSVGEAIEIRFDANQGYTTDDALRFAREVETAHVTVLEQPTPRNAPKAMAAVREQVPVPVMADESLVTLRDAYRVVRGDLADMINIKLMKVGGLAEAVQINAVARSARLEVMVGCLDEAGLAIAAGLHFAMARPNVEYVDLDGHFDLVGDPSAGAVILKDGYLYPTGEPGLGFSFDRPSPRV